MLEKQTRTLSIMMPPVIGYQDAGAVTGSSRMLVKMPPSESVWLSVIEARNGRPLSIGEREARFKFKASGSGAVTRMSPTQ